jgi:hypothetical protein
MAKHILTPNGDPMDYKVVKLKAKTAEEKLKDKEAKKKKTAKKKAKK